jgi:hypothetical protein
MIVFQNTPTGNPLCFLPLFLVEARFIIALLKKRDSGTPFGKFRSSMGR